MSTSVKRAVLFGVTSGFCWSVVGGALSNLFDSTGQATTAFVAGILTGLVVTLILLVPLSRFGIWSTILSGLAALPLGAFIFGVFVSVVQLAVSSLGGPTYRYMVYGFHPLQLGVELAILSIISLFALVLIPLALFTTIVMKKYVLPNSTHA